MYAGQQKEVHPHLLSRIWVTLMTAVRCAIPAEVVSLVLFSLLWNKRIASKHGKENRGGFTGAHQAHLGDGSEVRNLSSGGFPGAVQLPLQALMRFLQLLKLLTPPIRNRGCHHRVWQLSFCTTSMLLYQSLVLQLLQTLMHFLEVRSTGTLLLHSRSCVQTTQVCFVFTHKQVGAMLAGNLLQVLAELWLLPSMSYRLVSLLERVLLHVPGNPPPGS